MAQDGGQPSSSGGIPSRVGASTTQSLGPTRQSLITKGLIYGPAHGVVAFTVPGMADFISRQPDEDD